MANMLLVDSCMGSAIRMDLNESSISGSKTRGYKFRGKFQEANAVNKNQRMYDFKVLNENVKLLQEVMRNGGLIGELDHPTDSIIHFEKASHIVTKLWWEGNVLMGEGRILSTPHGMLLKNLMDDGVRIGISSRGIGNGKTNDKGILVIDESYKLITFDAVADPSTYSAFQERVVESNHFNDFSEKTQHYSTKNESSSIHNKVTKDALIACLGGLIQSQTANIIERLG